MPFWTGEAGDKMTTKHLRKLLSPYSKVVRFEAGMQLVRFTDRDGMTHSSLLSLSCLCHISRHLDFFEMVRNEDDLELAKRFDLVSACFTIPIDINTLYN